MNLIGAFLELDKLYEDINLNEGQPPYRVLYQDYNDNGDECNSWRVFHNIEEAKQFVADNKDAVIQIVGFKLNEEFSSDNLFIWKRLLNEAVELSTEHAVTTIVDQVKSIYEAGLFSKLPVGRENAFTLSIYGPDKERLAGYFKKQPEFTYELNNDSGIVSHEFISDKYDIEIFDEFVSMYKIPQNESLNEWKCIGTSTNTTAAQTSATSSATSPVSVKSSGNIVTIVYDPDKGKLRAQADDGMHGKANVAFPNNLRNQPGQQYEVETLVWNGKNYRASGKITPVNSVSNTQNINENIIKENNDMNFQTILEELDKLYEELPAEESAKKEDKKTTEVEEACEKPLAEADETPIVDDVAEDDDIMEIVDDEAADDADELPKQVVIECSKCGGLVIKDETDLKIDEETDLTNMDEECQYCEASGGYKIVGALAPYEAEEVLDEGIFDKFKKKKSSNNTTSTDDKESKVTFEIYDENGTCQFSRTFTELPGKMSAEEQLNNVIKSNGVLNKYKSSSKKYDWSYERKSDPASSLDTDKYFNAASKIIKEDVNTNTEDESLDELLNTKINVDATNFGGDNNDVSVLGLPEELDKKALPEDEELEELLNTKINVDARGFGGTGNNVDVV